MVPETQPCLTGHTLHTAISELMIGACVVNIVGNKVPVPDSVSGQGGQPGSSPQVEV